MMRTKGKKPKKKQLRRDKDSRPEQDADPCWKGAGLRPVITINSTVFEQE